MKEKTRFYKTSSEGGVAMHQSHTMETFADKVKSEVQFDPMMEEGGWIQGLPHKQDVEMAEVVIVALTEANKSTCKGGFNLFCAQ